MQERYVSLFLSLIGFGLFFLNPVEGVRDSLVGSLISDHDIQSVCKKAELFSVKIASRDTWGSGFIIRSHGSKYTVVTSAHVLHESETFWLRTSDGLSHLGSLLVRFDHGEKTGYDLAILQFESTNRYESARIEPIPYSDQTMSVGFPTDHNLEMLNDHGFYCLLTSNSETILLEKPMKSGYQLGHVASVPHGMSGGPLLNAKGYVIGVNGFTTPHLFLNPDIYQYRHGGNVIELSLSELSERSWSIPSKDMLSLIPISIYSVYFPRFGEFPLRRREAQ